jgi:hypothetical protein
MLAPRPSIMLRCGDWQGASGAVPDTISNATQFKFP